MLATGVTSTSRRGQIVMTSGSLNEQRDYRVMVLVSVDGN